MKRLYVFGDSIAFGQLVSPHLVWVTRLAQWAAVESSEQLLVQNAGVNGNTTRQGLERFHFDVISHSPRYLIVQFGLNDCNKWMTDNGLPRVSLPSFRSNLNEILSRARASYVEHVFVNTNHPTAKKEPLGSDGDDDYQLANRCYNAAIRELMEDLTGSADWLTLIDIESLWHGRLSRGDAALSELLLDDGIHLSELGHAWYYEIVRDALCNRGIP